MSSPEAKAPVDVCARTCFWGTELEPRRGKSKQNRWKWQLLRSQLHLVPLEADLGTIEGKPYAFAIYILSFLEVLKPLLMVGRGVSGV